MNDPREALSTPLRPGGAKGCSHGWSEAALSLAQPVEAGNRRSRLPAPKGRRERSSASAARLTLLRLLLSLLVFLVPACDRPPVVSTTSGPRLAVLSPAMAQTLRDLGLGDLMIARHGWDKWSNPALPVCGDQAGIDYEALIRVRPSHVLLQRADIPDRLSQLATARGWTILNHPALTLDEIRAMTRALAAIAPAPANLRELESAMDRAWSPRADIHAARIGRVLLLESLDPPAALGPGSFHHQILTRLGATPAHNEGAPYIVMDSEDLLRLAPDAIVVFSPRTPNATDAPTSAFLDAARIRAFLGPLADLQIPAVSNGRVASIDDPLCLLPSTSMISAADQLAAVLTEWSKASAAPR